MSPARRKQPPSQLPRLTAVDERVLAFIRLFQVKSGFAPTRQEIMAGLQLPNRMTAQRAVERLVEHKLISLDSNSIRGIETNNTEPDEGDLVQLPLLGIVAAGRPIEAVESAESFGVPRSMIRGSASHFVLKVKGDSMIEDHICDGDFVLVREQKDANNGDRVIALIDGQATLKRFYRRKGQVELHPSNTTMKPIVVGSHQELRIAGRYVGLVRIEK